MSRVEERTTSAPVHREEHVHPGPRRYVQIALILAALTAIEVELSYLPKQIDIGASVIIAPLIILAIVKFTMIAMFFMHLRFDNRLFAIMFVGGIAIALAAFMAVLTIQRVLFA